MQRQRVLIIIFALFFITTAPIFSGEEKVVWSDDFSSSQILRWREVRNSIYASPNTPCANTEQNFHWEEKDGVMGIVINGSQPCITEIIPEALQDFSSQHYAVEHLLTLTHPEMDRNLLLRWQDEDNWMGFHIFNTTIYSEKRIHGQPQSLGNSTYFLFEANKTYHIRMEYDASLYRIRLYIDGNLIKEYYEKNDEAQLLWGSPGLRASVGDVRSSEVWFDDFRLINLEHTVSLPLTLWKQTDHRWNNAPYDSAKLWSSNPTIGRWGCALTSAVMLLDFYDIKTLSDGTRITPITLDTWLQHEADGYLGTGLVNWRAITRLTWEHKQRFGTPALEYAPQTPPDKITWLRQELQEKRPVILAQKEHFVVADGFGPGEGDIHLSDPLLGSTTLREYNGTYISARQFIPSHTDLSSVMVISHPGVKVSFTREQATPVPVTSYVEDAFGDGDDNPYIVYDLAKPNLEKINISLEDTGPLFQPTTILSYDQYGDETILTLPRVLGVSEVTVFQTSQDAKISVLPSSPWVSFEQLSLAVSDGSFASPFIPSLILEVQSHIQASDSLDDASSWQRKLTLLLVTFEKNGWIQHQAAESLRLLSQQWLLARFP